MKKTVKATVLGAVAKAVFGTAKAACGAASAWDCYQPKEPQALKKMMNKK